MPTRDRSHERHVVFVSATRDSPGARTPGGGKRLWPDQSFLAALERRGLRTTSLGLVTKMVSLPWAKTRGYRSTRGVPVSPRFLLDLARSPATVFVCREYGVETLLTLLVARLRRRRSLVFQEHVGRAGAPLSRLDVAYRRTIARLADGFIANTPAAKDEIVRSLHADSVRVFEVMTLVPPTREELRLEPIEIEPPRNRPLFLFIGQLIPRKNVEALVRASKLLKDDARAFEVWIAGEGPDEADLRRLASDGGLDGVVRFVGPVRHSSVGFVYEACDVFVMPSHADLLSVAVLEALRFGRAVICSTGVGAAGVVAHDEVNALVFDPARPAELADRMRRFVDEPMLAGEMGSRSAEMMDRHTPDAAGAAFLDVVERVTAERR